MTTNTTRLAEAIGIISSVLSDEIAQSNHFVDLEDDEEDTVAVSDYNDLKEIITDAFPDIMTEIENIKTEIEQAVELDGIDDDDDSNDYGWSDDDDEDEDVEEESTAGDTEAEVDVEPSDAEKIDMLVSAGAELQEANERLLAALDSASEQLGDLSNAVETLQDEVEQL